jgi:predicted ATPase
VTKQLREPERELEAATRRSDVILLPKNCSAPKSASPSAPWTALHPGSSVSCDGCAGIGCDLFWPYYQALLGGALGHLGQPCDALAELGRAVAQARDSDARYWDAELHRSQGEMIYKLDSSALSRAEACLQTAIETSQRQRAKSMELRAATSLARLWRDQGRRAEAYQLPAPVYAWFTEGFDTADLKDAKALLDQLA